MEKTLKENLVVGQETDPITRPVKYRRTILESNARLWMTCVLVASDMLGLFIAILVALWVRHLFGIALDPYYREIFILLAIILDCCIWSKGTLSCGWSELCGRTTRDLQQLQLHIFDPDRRDVLDENNLYLFAPGVAAYLGALSSYDPGWPLLRFAGYSSACIYGASRSLSSVICTKIWPLAEYFRINLQLGLRPVAVLRDEYFSDHNSSLGPLLSIDQIRDYARNRSLNTALVVITDLNSLDSLVDRYRFVFQHVILIKGRNGSYTLNSLKSLDLSGILGLQVANNLLSFWAQVFKRTIDVLGSILGMVLLFPFFGLIALRHQDRFARQRLLPPASYRQERQCLRFN